MGSNPVYYDNLLDANKSYKYTQPAKPRLKTYFYMSVSNGYQFLCK